MKKMMLPALGLVMALGIGACEKGEEASEETATQAGGAAAEGEGHAHEGEDHAHEGEHHAGEGEHHADEAGEGEHHAAAGDTVEVAAGGTKFDPAIQAEKLPEGVWYCDMGTVHWAGQDEPADGKCPLCGMKVKKYEGGHHEGDGDHGHAH